MSEELEKELNEEPAETPDDAKNELSELNDKYLRTLAEFDNFKKRTQKEKTDIYVSATADTIEKILPVMDSIDRAIQLDPENEGLNLILKQLKETLSAIGVEEIVSVGEQFDPELHNAVMHIEDENFGNNTVAEEFAKGYKYKTKVIRQSMVKVAN